MPPTQVPIRQRQIIGELAEIDAFNHRAHPQIPPPITAHTMGDNDIWIAATAAVVNATLLTTDRDFDHLDGVFLKVKYIDQKLTPVLMAAGMLFSAVVSANAISRFSFSEAELKEWKRGQEESAAAGMRSLTGSVLQGGIYFRFET